jgi:hypothetical protein
MLLLLYPGDFAFLSEGRTVVFVGARELDMDPKSRKVYCPACRGNVSRKSARRHYIRKHTNAVGAAGGAVATNAAETSTSVETSGLTEVVEATPVAE